MKHQLIWFMVSLMVFVPEGCIEAAAFLEEGVSLEMKAIGGITGKELGVAAKLTEQQALKIAENAGLNTAEMDMKLFSKNFTAVLERAGIQNVEKFLPSLDVQSLKGLNLENLSHMEDAGIQGMASKLDKNLASKLTGKNEEELLEMGFTKVKASKILQSKSAGTSILSKSALKPTEQSLSKSAPESLVSRSKNALTQPFKKSVLTADQIAGKEALEAEIKGMDPGLERAAKVEQLEQWNYYASTSSAGRFARELLRPTNILMGASVAVGVIATGVLFMIPSFFQSAYLAQQAKNAMLETYLPPTQFGGVVMQLPDSVINMGNAMASKFIYYGIPVDNSKAQVSAAASAAYPGVSGPTSKNKVSRQVNNDYAQVYSVGNTKKIDLPRYNLDAQALAKLPIYVSYSPQSWTPWASSGIPDAAFPQAMINLNTGAIIYADGTSAGTPAAPLLGPVSGNTQNVQGFLTTKLGELKTKGSQATYTEFQNGFSSGRTGDVVDVIANQFNCACLQKNNGILSSDTMQSCSGSHPSTCLLTETLNQIAAGLVLNSQGTVLKPDQDLAIEIAQGALGQIIPIQGYGDKFQSILELFPGAAQNSLANSGALTVSLNTNGGSQTALMQGADPDNYVAKGLYVYQCQNTPLAKMLRAQAGQSLSADAVSQLTDFIVFLDANLNQVPLMAPVADPNNYHFAKMGLNPAVKYFSTILGSTDSNGGFSFLPQLNIQASQVLQAKGLPANFAPLYGLQAINGALSVNYNAKLASTIGAVAQSLASNPKLGQQFQLLQRQIISLLGQGPFGKYSLKATTDVTMNIVINGTPIAMYQGYNSYPIPQDQDHGSYSDILIPASTEGSILSLPSNNVMQYYGLVTDFMYTARKDGSIFVESKGFVNSPMSDSWAIDQAKVSQFFWLEKLTAVAQKSDSSFVVPPSLLSLVEQQRANWINWVQTTGANAVSKTEFTGVQIVGTSNILTTISQQALHKGLFIYDVSPCPSSLESDHFILTNSSAPQVSDTKLGTISALVATQQTNLLSIVSGRLYNSAGQVVKNSVGNPYSVDPKALLKSLQARNPQAFAPSVAVAINVAVGKAEFAAENLQYPIPFGSLQLGLYQADSDTDVYLYVDASGAGTSANFKPLDYFVTVDSYTNPNTLQSQVSTSTEYMVSLVSGKVYGISGVVGTMPASLVTRIIGALSSSWQSGVAANIASLTAQQRAIEQAQAEQTAAMNAPSAHENGKITLPQSTIVTMIANLNAASYLPEPYGLLKQDPASQAYVLVTPATADGTEFLYTLFDAQNSFIDADGHALHVAASYDGQGNLVRVFSGQELISLMHQYGVAIDSNHKQYLGANNSIPLLSLDPADLNLKPGSSGKSMIFSNDPAFPSRGIVSPINYQNSQFYIYFNTINQAYYAMKVNGSSISYIDIVGGNVYNHNGSAQSVSNPVAINSNGDLTDMLLPYLNVDHYMTCLMKNNGNNNQFSNFLNIESSTTQDTDITSGQPAIMNNLYSLDSQATNVRVAQILSQAGSKLPELSETSQYNVYWENSQTPETYKVNGEYSWQQLYILPIDMNTRLVLKSLPEAAYKSMGLVMNKNVPYACFFANKLYQQAQQTSSSSWTMKSGSDSITLSMQNDSKTNVAYLAITADGATYNYQYQFLQLSPTVLQTYQYNAWQAQTVVDINGNILLEQFLPVDPSSGALLLSSVSLSNVVSAPSDATLLQALKTQLARIMQDTKGKRFIVSIQNGQYSYFLQDGYVDLSTGALFDVAGAVVGYSLPIADLIALAQELSVSVVVNKEDGKVALMYRAPMPAQSGVSSDVASSARDSQVVVNVPKEPVASAASVVQAPVISSNQNSIAHTSTAMSVEQKLAALQKSLAQVKADMKNRQITMNMTRQSAGKKSSAQHKVSNGSSVQAGIAEDQKQIAILQRQIDLLKAQSTTGTQSSRSTLLGRLSSVLRANK